MAERLQRNQKVIDEFRSPAGVVGGDFDGVPLLPLTTTGARGGADRHGLLRPVASPGRAGRTAAVAEQCSAGPDCPDPRLTPASGRPY